MASWTRLMFKRSMDVVLRAHQPVAVLLSVLSYVLFISSFQTQVYLHVSRIIIENILTKSLMFTLSYRIFFDVSKDKYSTYISHSLVVLFSFIQWALHSSEISPFLDLPILTLPFYLNNHLLLITSTCLHSYFFFRYNLYKPFHIYICFLLHIISNYCTF